MSTGDALQTSETLWQQIIKVCPPDIGKRLAGLPRSVVNQMEEIRFRFGKPLQLCGDTEDWFLQVETGVTRSPSEGFIVTEEHLSRVVQAVTQSSLYAVEDELRRGFVTMPGGHRVGVAGRAVLNDAGGVRTLRSITSLNLRVAKERKGAADALRPFASRMQDGRPHSMLILSPPQCGKTTLLRDLARQWSEGMLSSDGRGVKVSVVDERSEIAGCIDGVPQFDLGPRADVLDACPKAEGMLMMIRSLSPDVVVTDEIGRERDKEAILEASHAGVAVLATAHASSVDEWRRRPAMNELFAARSFERYVLLSRRKGPGTVEQVLDASGAVIWRASRAGRRDEPC